MPTSTLSKPWKHPLRIALIYKSTCPNAPALLIEGDAILEDDDVQTWEFELMSVFLATAKNGYARAMQKLVAAGVVLEKQDGDGNTMRSLAAKRGHTKVVKTLLK